MIISYKNNFIYVRTRKTASSSIQESLFSYLGKKDICTGGNKNRNKNHKGFEVHPYLKQVISYLGENKFNNFYSFTFVRNPYDLMVSNYFWIMRKNKVKNNKYHFNQWLKKFPIITPNNLPKRAQSVEAFQQYKYTHKNKKQVLNFVGRYENIKKDFKNICQDINLPTIDISKFTYKANTRPKKIKYQKFYTEEGKKIIAKFFKKDLELFNYKF